MKKYFSYFSGESSFDVLPFYYGISFLLGIITSLFLGFFIPQKFFLLGIAFLFVVMIPLFVLRKKIKIFFLCVLFFIGVLLGFFRLEFTTYKTLPQNHVQYFIGQKIEITGTISEEVDKRISYTQYIVEVDSVEKQQAQGRVLVKANTFPEFFYGDKIKIQGKLETIPETEDFSYKNYLSRYEVYALVSYAKIEKIGENPSSHLRFWLYQQKEKFLNAINNRYHDPQSAFLAGLLIGERAGMGDEITQNFQKSGLSHIVAVSGSNITILLAILFTLLSFLPRPLQFFSAAIAIILFTIFVGMSAAVVRAAIMGVIGLLAVNLGRPQFPLSALLLTVAIMAWYQPKILLFDVGFQLSIAAVIGVIWLVPLFPSFFQKLPETFGVKEAVALTLAAQITTLPVSLFQFHSFSLIAPIANLFVVPVIPFAMLFGSLSLIPIPFVSDALALCTHFLLSLSLFFASFFAKIPFASFQNIYVAPFWIFILTLVIFSSITALSFRKFLVDKN